MSENKNELGMDHKTTCWFAYVISLISAIIVLATVKNDSRARLHAWQSLFLGIFVVVVYIVLGVLAWIPYIGILFTILFWLAWVGFIVLSVVCIIRAINDDIFKIPVIYNLAEKQK
jgi:uncharacterized membrane protein